MFRFIYIFILIFILLFFTTWKIQGQELQRKAFLGVYCAEKNDKLVVDSVVSGATFDQAGIRRNDILLSINKNTLNNLEDFFAKAASIRSGEEVSISYRREGEARYGKAIAIARPKFTADWCRVSYQSLYAVDCTLRTIVYSPKNSKRTPGIFFIPGYNCGSIENYQGNFNGKMIEYWVKNGYTVYTVEKSGLGDSYGCKPCVEVDLQNDIDLFETAYRDFITLPNLDTSQVFIWGHSMGGIIAPIIAQQKRVKGIMVFGTVFRPWSEFLLEMHRVQKPLLDSFTFEETESFVRTIQKIYYEFFILKKTPAQLHQNSEYREIMETELEYKPGKTGMWGRHWRFWQQLDSINLAKAWQDLSCKVLVVHGASDFIQCSAVEPYLIAETVNQSHKGNATLLTLPGLDHLIMNSKDYPEAVRNMNNKEYVKGNFNIRLAEETVKWMKNLN